MESNDPIKNVAETMRDVMQDFGEHEHVALPDDSPLTTPFIISMPTGRTHVDLTEVRRKAAEHLKPARRRGTAHPADLISLIAWSNRFKGDTSVLFANPDMASPTLTCIADYHASGPVDIEAPEGDPTARHCAHRATYSFPLSDEWNAWMAISGEGLDKDQMGEFIEAQAKDVMDPTPAVTTGKVKPSNEDWENRLIETAQKIEGRFGQLGQLLAMSKQFQVYETSDLKVATNRDTGEAEIQFLNEHKTADGKKLEIPNLIIIAIPVFMGGAPYRMAVRFRYRKMGGSIKFIMSIYNPERVFEAAFREAVEQATAETELPTFLGLPETP